jgi:hypothetical protein
MTIEEERRGGRDRGTEREMRDDHAIGLASCLVDDDDVCEIGFLSCFNKFVDAVVASIDRLRVGDAHFNLSDA